VLQCVAVCCDVLQCVAVTYFASLCMTVQRGGSVARNNRLCWKCATVCYSVLQFYSLQCHASQSKDVRLWQETTESVAVCCNSLQCDIVRGSALQCAAACCGVLRCVAVSFSATHYITKQRSATYVCHDTYVESCLPHFYECNVLFPSLP